MAPRISVVRIALWFVFLNLLAFGPVASSAIADSIVYIKASNVWLANPDGTGAYQVTRDGSPSDPYSSPSQANDGAILAIKGSGTTAQFHHLRQNGSLIDPPFDHSAPAHPHDAQLSPDGRLVAYYWIGITNSCYPYSCVAGNPKTFFSHSNRFTPGEEITNDVNFQNPSWMSNSRVFLSYGASRTYTYNIGDEDATVWFADSEVTVYDPDLDASNSRIVVIADRDSGMGEKLVFFITNGEPPAEPTRASCFFLNPVGGSFNDPTFAPDGRAVAWEEGDGIWRATVGALDSSDCAAAFPGGSSLLVPGGSEPDWGPANVNPGPRTGTGTADTTKPVIGSLALAPTRFRTGAGRGTKISFTLSEAAVVAFGFERVLPGRRSGGRCVAPTRRNRNARPCKRYREVPGAIVRTSAAGATRFKFTGRVEKRTLAPGNYRLSAVAIDGARNQSNLVRRSFSVVR